MTSKTMLSRDICSVKLSSSPLLHCNANSSACKSQLCAVPPCWCFLLFLLVGASCCSSLLVLHHRHPLETGRVTRKPGLSLSDLKQLCSSSSREHLQLSSSVSHVAHIGHDKEIGHSTPPAQVADIGHERPIAFVFMISNACLLAPINKMHWNQFLI